MKKSAGDAPQGLAALPARQTILVHAAKHELGSTPKVNLKDVATTVVALYNLAPPLAQTAERMDNHAQEQAATVGDISQKTETITRTLNSVIEELEACSKEAFSSLKLIKEITDTAKILAINASIEAARAGEAGRPFSVVASEMQRLSTQTEEASQHMAGTLQNMLKKVNDVVLVVGKPADESSPGAKDLGTSNASSVSAVTRAFHQISSRAVQQQQEAHQVHEMSEKTRKFSEKLLLEIGKLRFGIHSKSESAIAVLMKQPGFRSGTRDAVEPLLMRAIQKYPFFDLLYVTDGSGRQITRNIGHDSADSGAGADALGHDWSQRPWYLNALAHCGPVTSDIYLPVTTNRFCFTVSETIHNETGAFMGVLGADVDFERLLHL